MQLRSHFRSHIYYIASLAVLITLLIGWITIDGFKGQISNADGLSSIGGCPMYPADNIWNYDISHLPVNSNSANFIKSIGPGLPLHPDFGTGTNGIPYNIVPANQKYVPVHFVDKQESDPGPYPIPPNAKIEAGGDHHVLVVDKGTCNLYEMYHSQLQHNGSWNAYSGARWDLNSNHLRTSGWTSADAAGLPILPGLVRYDEVASGVINHALRFTVSQTQAAFLWPARHFASSSHNPNLPPMGLRIRLKASVDISHFSRTDQVILTALKHYGMFVADNGSSWFLSGAPDNRWNNNDLHQLDQISGTDFEAVDESSLEGNPNSGKVKQSNTSSLIPHQNNGIAGTTTLHHRYYSLDLEGNFRQTFSFREKF
ncbi:MAG TPA: hypothetical protein VKU38_14085 [Ktedonobacteraceae bacterium]|nr:hypothetical protein [Ktedonobacteraceae bacterium]